MPRALNKLEIGFTCLEAPAHAQGLSHFEWLWRNAYGIFRHSMLAEETVANANSRELLRLGRRAVCYNTCVATMGEGNFLPLILWEIGRDQYAVSCRFQKTDRSGSHFRDTDPGGPEMVRDDRAYDSHYRREP